jgi:16S rRNA processing protein RimM
VRLVVGRVGRPHGVRGELAVTPSTDEPELRLAVGEVLTTDPAAAGPLTVAASRWHSGRLLLRFDGVTDRTGAEALRGTWLQAQVDPAQRPADPAEYYDRQLVGLAVVTPDGGRLGEVAEVVHLPGQDLLAIRREGRADALVPFVAQLVPEIDLPAGRVVVDPPAGLLDLDEAD